ncbi:G protein pathway suppressor 2-like [Rhipicephalus sanguineus]|nr:G protein pathway suppressor 2-like [Rhipicephalus sanguineus]
MSLLVERPKMNLQTWAALKTYIMRERERKRLEQATAEAFERRRQEQELMLRQDDMMLQNIRDEIRLLEQLVQELKQEEQQLLMLEKLRIEVQREDNPRHPAIGRDVGHAHAA